MSSDTYGATFESLPGDGKWCGQMQAFTLGEVAGLATLPTVLPSLHPAPGAYK